MNKIIQGRCRGASVNSNAVNVYRLDLEIPEDTYNDYLERNFLVKENLHGFYMVIFRHVRKAKAIRNIPPKLFDYKKDPTDVSIGDGSLVRVLYREFVDNNPTYPCNGFDLQAVQILELISDDEVPNDFLIDYASAT